MFSNRYNDFFYTMFTFLLSANLMLGILFFRSMLKSELALINNAVDRPLFFLLLLVVDFLLIMICIGFFRLFDNFDEEGFESKSAYLVSMLGAPIMIFFSILGALGITLMPVIFRIPLWGILTIFFINIMISMAIQPGITGSFLIDVTISSALLTIVSVVVGIGVNSLFTSGFHYPWEILLVETGLIAVILRFFLWKYEN